MIHPDAHRYLPIIRWSDEDGCFVGSCPPIVNDCCHGDDPAKVMKELQVIIGEVLDIMAEDETPLPSATDRNYSGKIPLRIHPALHRAIAARAVANGDSLNRYIERMLNEAIAPRGRQSRPARRVRRAVTA